MEFQGEEGLPSQLTAQGGGGRARRAGDEADPKPQRCSIVQGVQESCLPCLLPAADFLQGQAAFSLSASVPQMESEEHNISSVLPAGIVQF